METVVMILMALVCVSFVLKLTCLRAPLRWLPSLLCAAYVMMSYEEAAAQSSTRIAQWLGSPELMADMAVWITVDVAFQLWFCMTDSRTHCPAPTSRRQRVSLLVSGLFPGVLIFPVLTALLTALIFSLPGVEFAAIALWVAAGVLVLPPLLAAAVRWLLPEWDIRLELIFMINIIIALLGVVATVNGRTAATGTDSVALGPLGAVILLFAAGMLAGILIFRKKLKKWN